jgi:hypothetical protein
VAKGSAKKPSESKCRGSGAPLEGRDWVRIGGSKWLREVAEKQGKFIPREYAEKSGAEFEKERSARSTEKENAPVAAEEAVEPTEDETTIPDAEAPIEEIVAEEEDATYSDA